LSGEGKGHVKSGTSSHNEDKGQGKSYKQSDYQGLRSHSGARIRWLRTGQGHCHCKVSIRVRVTV
jgi:hypothetical protein